MKLSGPWSEEAALNRGGLDEGGDEDSGASTSAVKSSKLCRRVLDAGA